MEAPIYRSTNVFIIGMTLLKVVGNDTNYQITRFIYNKGHRNQTTETTLQVICFTPLLLDTDVKKDFPFIKLTRVK